MLLNNSPTGRLVSGSPHKAEPVTNDDGTPKLDLQGKPVLEYYLLVAFAKGDPAWLAYKAQLMAEDKTAWPQFFDAAGNVLPGVRFANKIYDGDGYNSKGKHNGAKDGWAGHEVVKFNSQFAPTVATWDGKQWVASLQADLVVPGDYIQVRASHKTNASNQTPGMYRNLEMVAFIGKGVPITFGVDPNEAFGGAPVLPPGASHMPQAPAAPLPQAAGAPPAPATPAAAPTPPTSPPYSGYMQAPPAAPPAPAPSGPQLTPAGVATGHTYEQYRAGGWTDDQLRAAGYLI